MSTDFGHFGYVIPGASIDSWGAGPFRIISGRRSWRFEYSDRFGPMLVDKKGEVLKDQPVLEKDPFWYPFHAWLNQGRKVDGDLCVWRDPKPMVIRRIAGTRRDFIIVEIGEDGGKIIKLPPEKGSQS